MANPCSRNFGAWKSRHYIFYLLPPQSENLWTNGRHNHIQRIPRCFKCRHIPLYNRWNSLVRIFGTLKNRIWSASYFRSQRYYGQTEVNTAFGACERLNYNIPRSFNCRHNLLYNKWKYRVKIFRTCSCWAGKLWTHKKLQLLRTRYIYLS